MKTIETERLTLRKWLLEDLDDFYEYARNPNVGPMAGWEPHSDKSVTLNILKSNIESDNWAIVCKENNKVIGSLKIGTCKKRKNINAKYIGYALSADYWGKGLMTEAVKKVVSYAFEEMGIDLLSVWHFSINARSKRVVEKCGFRYEGTLRQAYEVYNGQIHDDVCYSITKSEYYAK